MALFVHLTPAVNVPRIRRSGIRADRFGDSRGVYCFPVLPSYTLTHQWLRELARFGGRGGFVAVHVRLDDAEPVRVGHYRDRTRSGGADVTAAEAVGRIAELADPRGWEVFVPRAIGPREVHRVRPVPQGVGWRYQPDAHGRKPCACPACQGRGAYGARRLRARLDSGDGPPLPVPLLLTRLAAAEKSGDTAALCDALNEFSRRRRGPLRALAPFADHPDPEVREFLVWTIARWTTPGTAELLARLAADPDPAVRGAVTDARP
ncbi:HEAT repeat domain-containing protein [Streptomyces sp. NPDC090025]|uniref:HEAT repeat domain-containing protein n=1 Tax=Streptomyces sp. NPDC090025 TaxID=3365922 RepID=UPI0038393D2F